METIYGQHFVLVEIKKNVNKTSCHVVQSFLTALRAAPEQLAIPLDKLHLKKTKTWRLK